jgi:hypothetical protein
MAGEHEAESLHLTELTVKSQAETSGSDSRRTRGFVEKCPLLTI